MAKVLFIQKNIAENIALMQLSAVLKARGHACDLIAAQDCNHVPIDYIKEYKPDIIAFSVMTPMRFWARDIALCIKQSSIDAKIVAGGPHPTFFPDFIENEGIDIINIGEGEYSLAELADAIDAGGDISAIKNFHVKADGAIYKNPLRPLVAIDELPFPDRDIFLKCKGYDKQSFYYLYISKGCPFNCKFCFMHQFKELYASDPACHKLRIKSVDYCINEVKDAVKKIRIKFIMYMDSTFNLNKEWMLEFLKAYKQHIGIPFSINIMPNLITEEIVKAIADTNCCAFIRMGVEVGNEDYRKKILGKNITNQKIIDCVHLLKKYKIKFLTYNMFGLPGENAHHAYETLELNKKLKPDFFVPMIFQALPGLDITNYAIKHGSLSDDDFKQDNASKNEMYYSMLRQPDIDEVANICKLSIMNIKYPFLTKIIRKLAKRKPNKLFDKIYFLFLFFQYKKLYNMSLLKTIKAALGYGL